MTSFWVGMAVAVPIGILVNLITPPIGRFVAKRNSAVRRRMAENGQLEKDLANWLIANPQAMVMHFLNQRMQQMGLFTTVVFGSVVYLIAVAADDGIFGGVARAVVLAGMVASMGIYVRRLQRTSRIWDEILKGASWVDWHGGRWDHASQTWVRLPIDGAELPARGLVSEKSARGSATSAP
ncbi:hypothetical protein ACIBQ2_25515 [Micromonospora sediminimaris]|uniref:hypothetical protein n=1 Tax=Micromonospora sediminimaris TaxID=547162 RepID=UPI0037A4EBEC